ERFLTIARAAGSALPPEFWPPARLFPFWNELANQRPSPVTRWTEFLYVAQCVQFTVEMDWPTKGSRIALLKGEPSLTSALAIDQFILPFSKKLLAEYWQMMQIVDPHAVETVNESSGLLQDHRPFRALDELL